MFDSDQNKIVEEPTSTISFDVALDDLCQVISDSDQSLEVIKKISDYRRVGVRK